MIDAVERIQLNVERYARRAGTTERLRQAAAEHWQIFKAIERKEFTKAGDLLERHILHTGEEIRRTHEKMSSLPPGKRRNKDRKRPAIKK
jgi:DNA-binding GntR family transcriptional regulator